MLIPLRVAEFEIIVKKSRFIALAEPLENPKAARIRVKALREQHPGANHVVHAFVAGPRGEVSGLSDDGEPSGTAGRPVYDVLGGRGITNVLVAVIRYFGGTKLGTGGLVKAYGDAAKGVLDALPVEELVEKSHFALDVPYHLFERVKTALEAAGAVPDREDFGDTVRLEGILPASARETLRTAITDMSSGRVEIRFPDA